MLGHPLRTRKHLAARLARIRFECCVCHHVLLQAVLPIEILTAYLTPPRYLLGTVTVFAVHVAHVAYQRIETPELLPACFTARFSLHVLQRGFAFRRASMWWM